MSSSRSCPSPSWVPDRLVWLPLPILPSAVYRFACTRLGKQSALTSAIGATCAFSRRGSKALIPYRGGSWRHPAGASRRPALPTGTDLCELYLASLAALPALAGSIETDARVIAITRHGIDKMSSKDRAERPFSLRITNRAGRQRVVLFARSHPCVGNLAQPQSARRLRVKPKAKQRSGSTSSTECLMCSAKSDRVMKGGELPSAAGYSAITYSRSCPLNVMPAWGRRRDGADLRRRRCRRIGRSGQARDAVALSRRRRSDQARDRLLGGIDR